MKSEMLSKTLETIVVEISSLQDRIKKLESIFLGPENDLNTDIPAAAAIEKPAVVAIVATEQPAAIVAETAPLFPKPTAEEASRRAKKAWETRRARKNQPKPAAAEKLNLTFLDLVAAARK